MRFRVPVLVESLGDGSVRMAPVAERRWLAHGPDRALATSELVDALVERLNEATPERIRELTSLPDTAHVVRVMAEIAVPLDVKRTIEMAFDCVVVPDTTGSFVVVPAIDHAVHVAPGEELERQVAKEIGRIARARDNDGRAFFTLLPAESAVLVRLEVDVPRIEEEDQESRFGQVRARAARMKEREATELLQRVGRPLAAPPAPLAGRAGVIEEITALLSAKERFAVLVTGPELVGKTAVIASLALHGLRVHALSGADFLAGTGGAPGFHERVQTVMAAAELLDVVVYLEDARSLVTDRPDSPIDLASALAPILDARRVRFVTEARDLDVDRVEGRHARLASSLVRVRVEPLSVEASREALVERAASPSETVRPSFTLGAIDAILRLSTRYAPNRALPGEAVRLFDELRQTVPKVRDEAGIHPKIDERDVVDAFARRTGLSVALLRPDVALDPTDIERFFGERLIGQPTAVRAVAEALAVVKTSLASDKKPIATFLFVGPTGVGKTELARLLGRYLFGRESALVRFDMSEYGDPLAGDRLVRGSDREDGLLTRAVRRMPFSVVLFDEIEKAHPSVLDVLLSVLGEGRLSDARGRLAYFHNTLLVMTSNVGARGRRARAGFAPGEDTVEEHYVREVERTFRPELVNRLDRIVCFDALGPSEIREVTRIALARLPNRAGLRDRSINLSIDEAAEARLAERGTRPADGARALRRTIEDDLVAPLARVIGKLGAKADRAEIRVVEGEAEGAPIDVRVLRQRTRRAESSIARLESIAARRRRVERWLTLDDFTDVAERLARLTADLHRALARDTEEARASIPGLTAELSRLSGPLEKMNALHRDLTALEELALGGFLAEQPIEQTASEVDALEPVLHRAMLDVLRIGQSGITDRWDLIVTAVEHPSAMRFYLAPLLAELEQRHCGVRVHAPRTKDDADDAWPSTRPWGPPHTSDWARAALTKGPAAPRSLFVVVESRAHAFVLREEAGVHSLLAGDREEAQVVVSIPSTGVASDDAVVPAYKYTRERRSDRVYDPARGLVGPTRDAPDALRHAIECDVASWATRLDSLALVARVRALLAAKQKAAQAAVVES